MILSPSFTVSLALYIGEVLLEVRVHRSIAILPYVMFMFDVYVSFECSLALD